MILASSGASAVSCSARASTTFCRVLPGAVIFSRARRTRARCSPGEGTASTTRTAGSESVGQSGSPAVRRTARGAINAAGLSTSKANAPSTIGTSPECNADWASVTLQKRACVPSATRVPVGPHSANGGSAVIRMREAERNYLADPVFEAADRDAGGAHAEAAALDQRQLHPAGDDGARKVAMTHEHHVARRHQSQSQRNGPVGAVADLRDAFTAWATVRPDRPMGLCSVDLRGRHAFVRSVIPFTEQLGFLVDGQAGEFGGLHRTPTRAADHLRVVQPQVGQCGAGFGGLSASVVGEVEIGAPGVLARLGPLGLAVSQQHKPVALDAHAVRFCLRLMAIRARAPWVWCQDGTVTRRDDAERSDEEARRQMTAPSKQ